VQEVRNVRLALACLGSLAAAAAGAAPVTSTNGSPARLSAEERKHALDGSFTLMRRVGELPVTVKRAFSGDAFEMADPGEKWQSTDVIAPGKRLPTRRLVLAGCSKARCFLHYERGGRGHGFYVVVFAMSEEREAAFLWAGASAAARDGAAELDTLRARIASGDFRDDLPFFW
jgi:hypothetical protein